MNPIIRNFLPSIARGVYRYDQHFCEVASPRDFNRFATGKLRLLPISVLPCLKLNGDTDWETLRDRWALAPAELEDASLTTRRADLFFARHSYFANALERQPPWASPDNFLEIQFVRRILAPLLNDHGMEAVKPQHPVGPYVLDFALLGSVKYAFEVDGFTKFQSRPELDQFLDRQNYIISSGWQLFRFSYGQIMATPAATIAALRTVLERDSRLRAVLRNHAGTPSTSHSTTIEIVNDFYRVQDFFVEAALSSCNPRASITLHDAFGFDFPFVATAISALYEYLNAVESVVNVSFDLPPVAVSSSIPLDREPPLHPLVSLSLASPHSHPKIVLSPSAVRQIAFSAPPPPAAAGTTTFRQGLSLEEIHNRLDYFTREIFGYPRGTKPLQDRILKRIFEGENVLGISATGSGKSLCFWLPALLRPGVTLVVCPLRSLMRDQRLNLNAYGIASAEFINTDVPAVEQRRILTEARRGELRLLYLSPERLRMKKFLAELAQLQEVVPINLLAVDEAHCISEWGHDFRPSYLKLPFLREMLNNSNPDLQLAALTATAGPLVEQDMRGILKLSEADVVREKKADREHFSYQIVQVPESASKTKIFYDILVHHLPKALKQPSLSGVLSHVNARNEKAIGIVFCIYADPHGQHSTKDGVAHFTYEIKRLLEPDSAFTKFDGSLRFRQDAFSTGRVRAFASKEPSLCPNCGSYEYVSLAKAPPRQGQRVPRTADDGAAEPGGSSVGVKICLHCGHKFHGRDAVLPNNWDEVLRTN